jgi:PST family polysaccharide transporter
VTHFALAQKEIDFRTRTIAELSDVVVRGAVGVALALAGAGAWSLVIGYLAGSAAMTASLWALVPWRPRIGIVRSDVRSLLRFGGAITALDVLSAIIANVDYIFVGRVLGAAPLGLYTLGYRLPELLVVNLAVVAGLVLFPAFAGIERSGLGDAFVTSLRYTLMVGIPLSVGLAVLAEPVTLAAFGDQWHGSVAVMRVLTVFAFAVTIGMPAGTAYKSLGRVDVLLKLAIPRAILAVTAIAIFADQGIVAVAACQAGVAALFAAIGIALAARLLGTGGRQIATAALPAVSAGVPLAVVLLAVEHTLDDPWLTLAAALPLGAVTYVGALWLVAPDALRRLWRTAFPSGLSGGRAEARAAPPPTP